MAHSMLAKSWSRKLIKIIPCIFTLTAMRLINPNTESTARNEARMSATEKQNSQGLYSNIQYKINITSTAKRKERE